MRKLLELYMVFCRIGAVSFGGGYAMLPILRREIVQKRHWLDEETVMDYYAVSQGLPGIISVNVSTFIGNSHGGPAGGVAAALGVASPCIVIITAIALVLAGFKDNVYVRRALAGVSVCVTALILDAVISMFKKGVKDIGGVLICLAMLALSLFTSLSPILLVVSCAVLGIVIQSLRRSRKKGGEER